MSLEENQRCKDGGWEGAVISEEEAAKEIVTVTQQPGTRLPAVVCKHNRKIGGARKRFLLTGYPIRGGVGLGASLLQVNLFCKTQKYACRRKT